MSQSHVWRAQQQADTAVGDWSRIAACAGEDLVLFFGPEGERPADRQAREAEAKDICQRCPVIRECAEHALTSPERYGLWGGMSETERADERRRRQRRKEAAAA